MNDKQSTIYNMLKSYYRNQNTPTHSEVKDRVNLLASLLYPGKLLSKELEEIVEYYEINIGVKAFDPDTITAKNMSSKWFEDKKNDPNRKHLYWERYADYLSDDKDFSEDTIRVIKRSTEEILGYCANPTPSQGEIKKKKGLVIGDVQSGKTANYLALVNMAYDYDYKLIIILAGLTNSLRIQTQERVDEGVIGAISNTIGSDNIKYVGVGKLKKERYAVTLTNIDKDFTKDSLNALNNTTGDYNKPVILVVKKNKSTLENVKKWLKPNELGVTDHILIIDDEADNASINTKKEDEDPSAINALIRDLYNNFQYATYVGFTATPFANIFINPDDEDSYNDLYPADFLVLLNTPTSYFGSEKVFGPNNDGKTRYIREVDEDESLFLGVGHKKDDEFYGLSNSLKEAIQTFFINSVIRTKRGKPYAHRTMMINISRFNKMQSKVKRKVSEYIHDLKETIIQTSYMKREKFLRNKELFNMYNLYMTSDYYNEIRDEVPWEEIQAHLGYEAERMQVILINGLKDEEKLDYKSLKDIGARYIVIGGFVLSRGLTLEGLMVSYYSRNGSAYDTLLQMCRWFGYRPKYEDLCRIYMSKINIAAFCNVIDAVNDLKQQFREMKTENKTPNDFGLMVKTCPEILNTSLLPCINNRRNTLLVTSRSKSRNSFDRPITLNYSCKSIDTSKIYIDKANNDKNLKIIREELEEKLGDLVPYRNRLMYRYVDKSIIISILKKISIPFENTTFDTLSICDFLEHSERLSKWDVVIATGDDEKSKPFIFGGKEILPAKRSFVYRNDIKEDFLRIAGKNNRLMDPGILNSGLDEETKKEIKSSVKGTPSASDYLKRRNFPILVIYPIDLIVDNDNPVKQYKIDIKNNLGGEHLIGFGIGFPRNGEGICVTYKLNKRKQEEFAKRSEEMRDDNNE